MIGHLRYLGLLLPITFSSRAAEQNPAVHIAAAGSQNAVFGSAENFTGRVRVDPLFKPDNDIPVSGAYVTFEPGARSARHTHLAITGIVDGKSVNWKELVTDEQYHAH
ncbi:cupin domain-containing protein [Superficieibacter sp. HKU1]|uniref:cupin domain-containing protein n=1 Tax=Superficieibacter sp. HKU1 TaxID=3031919 RepID=UPI0023E29ADB|nr:cupin domain-containing protein [Superficieibacter sp. HKU1]WES70356.1 cupin domain-containing protein [Superficieibacter sp. HKU1]